MKNIKYFPFERNRYFYGKFLSVDDFEAEQRYMNDKRRMLNHFLHGSGVVCGMQVVQLDELSVSIEAGLALDFAGREIVVASPVSKRLSAIEGFSAIAEEEEERQQVYLCIGYDEKTIEPVHNITRTDGQQGEEYNKYAETYCLFLSSEEPEQEGFQTAYMHESCKTIYQGEGIRIRQFVPQYMKCGEESQIRVVIEKEEEKAAVVFQYQLRLELLEQQGNDYVYVSFDEREYEAAQTYTMYIRVRAKNVAGQMGCVETVSDSFCLSIGDYRKNEVVSGKFDVRLTGDGVPESIIKNFHRTSMEDLMQNPYGEVIYLARLNVIFAGDAYIIERVEPMPFQQYIWNGMLSEALESLRLSASISDITGQNSFGTEETEPDQVSPSALKIASQWSAPGVTSGSVVLDLGLGAVAGKRFYSEEIIHGLGLGDVSIILGAARGIQEGNQIIYGEQSVFEEKNGMDIALAAKVNPKRGCFVIGMHCRGFIEAKKVKICWTAVKEVEYTDKLPQELAIRPNMAELSFRESLYFEAVLDGEVQKHVNWTIKEAEGGSIDNDGCYMSPSMAGVYEIRAEFLEQGAGTASAYVIVRGRDDI
ncbi:MAG: hypothetical protein K2G89_11345 [Lachnospiraceae bacterium]|nr:hypothetical protein [Lachnospiraceae bacterium]